MGNGLSCYEAPSEAAEQERELYTFKEVSSACWCTDLEAFVRGSPHAQELTEKEQTACWDGRCIQAYQHMAFLNGATDGGENSPVVFLKLDYLLELQAERDAVPCRQDLPQHAVFDGVIGEGVLVLALSYCWCTAEHPDPELKILDDICRFARYLEETRYMPGCEEVLQGIRSVQVVVFWDFASLYQRSEDRPLTVAQERSYHAGLDIMDLIYAHRRSWVLACTQSYGNSSYWECGRPFFEWCLAQLSKDADLVIDLPIALDFIKRTEDDFQHKKALHMLREACRSQARRQLPMTPQDFNAALLTKILAGHAEEDLLKQQYCRTFKAVVQSASNLHLRDVSCLNAANWRHFLSETVPLCGQLRCLDLCWNEALVSTLEPVAGLASLQVLRVSLCVGLHGSLKPLGGLGCLRELEAQGCVGLQGDLEPLADLVELRSMDLQACTGLRGSMLPLRPLQKLRVLDVRGTSLEGWEELGREGLAGEDHRPERRPDAQVLCSAASGGLARTTQLLLDHGLAVNEVADGGISPLHAAVQRGHLEIVRHLLGRGAGVNQATRDGSPPLYLAAKRGHVEVARELLESGAAVNQVKQSGASSLAVAAANGHYQIVCLLLERKASVTQATKNGVTPIDAAEQAGHLDIRQLLRGHAPRKLAVKSGRGDFSSR